MVKPEKLRNKAWAKKPVKRPVQIRRINRPQVKGK